MAGVRGECDRGGTGGSPKGKGMFLCFDGVALPFECIFVSESETVVYS